MHRKTTPALEQLRKPLSIRCSQARLFRRFDYGLAVDLGVPAAILFQSFVNWCTYSLNRGLFLHDGLAWTYRSREGLLERHRELSIRDVRVAVQALRKARLVLARKGLFEAPGHHNVTWYALGPGALRYLSDKAQQLHRLKEMANTAGPARIQEKILDEVSS